MSTRFALMAVLRAIYNSGPPQVTIGLSDDDLPGPVMRLYAGIEEGMRRCMDAECNRVRLLDNGFDVRFGAYTSKSPDFF